MKGALFLSIIVFGFSCSSERTDNDDYYKVINELLKRESEFDTCILVYQPLRFSKSRPEFNYFLKNEKNGVITFPKTDDGVNFQAFLHELIFKKNLSEEEAKELYDGQNPELKYNLDTTQILSRSINESQAKRFLVFPRKKGKLCKVSYPIFNRNNTILLLRFEVNHIDGGRGANYLFRKERGNWVLKMERSAWISG